MFLAVINLAMLAFGYDVGVSIQFFFSNGVCSGKPDVFHLFDTSGMMEGETVTYDPEIQCFAFFSGDFDGYSVNLRCVSDPPDLFADFYEGETCEGTIALSISLLDEGENPFICESVGGEQWSMIMTCESTELVTDEYVHLKYFMGSNCDGGTGTESLNSYARLQECLPIFVEDDDGSASMVLTSENGAELRYRYYWSSGEYEGYFCQDEHLVADEAFNGKGECFTSGRRMEIPPIEFVGFGANDTATTNTTGTFDPVQNPSEIDDDDDDNSSASTNILGMFFLLLVTVIIFGEYIM